MEQTDKPNAQVANIEDYEKYLLHSRGEIIQKLRQLGKDKNLVTAHVGNETILTAIIDVLSDNDLVVLDYAAEEKLNKKLVEAKRVILHTQHQGITAQFTVSNIKKARLKGNTVLACPLPENLLWVQRREAYRVRIPRSSRVTCEFYNANQTRVECDIIDISASGFAISNEHNKLNYQVGDLFQNCKLHLADFGSATIDIEIRNEIQLPDSLRIGCAFINLNTDTSSIVQRFIHMIDALQRQVAD